MKSPAQRKRDQRAKLKQDGYVQKEIWIKPEWWEKVKSYLSRLRERD